MPKRKSTKGKTASKKGKRRSTKKVGRGRQTVENPLTGRQVLVSDRPGSVYQRLINNEYEDEKGVAINTRKMLGLGEKVRSTKGHNYHVTAATRDKKPGRGGNTRGAKELAASLNREALESKHPECFLWPEENKYPVCDQSGVLRCSLVKSARRRANINAFTARIKDKSKRAIHKRVFEAASKLDRQYCGGPQKFGGH